MEVCYKSKGLNFKWKSPLTGGETLGVISEVGKSIKYDSLNDIKCEDYFIVSNHGQTYSLDECVVEIGGEYIEITGKELCK
mgnify:FL=1